MCVCVCVCVCLMKVQLSILVVIRIGVRVLLQDWTNYLKQKIIFSYCKRVLKKKKNNRLRS